MTDLLSNPVYEQPVPKRPTFLTVLCILTFVGSGWLLLSNVYGYFTADTAADAVKIVKSVNSTSSGNQSADEMRNKMMDQFSVFTVENIKNNALVSAGAALFCLIGAIMMFGLKKTGFYVYLLGTIICIAGPLVIFGFGNLIGLGNAIFWGLGGLAFCIMYGVNLKYMK